MKTVAVIPARWGSTRFEGKVLADIHGKPMIQHVYERVKQAAHVDDVWIACDADHVLKAAQDFGAHAVMTSVDHPSGSDRIAEAVRDIEADVIVNVQGDEPLIEPKQIDALVKVFEEDSECPMATMIKRIDDEEDLDNSHVVKVVVDNNGRALYFSRSPIPFNRDCEHVTHYRHLGIYAYRKDFLFKYVELPHSKLEQAEKLEQLRVLEAGYEIKTVETDMDIIGVDTPEDLQKVLEKL